MLLSYARRVPNMNASLRAGTVEDYLIKKCPGDSHACWTRLESTPRGGLISYEEPDMASNPWNAFPDGWG